MTFQIWANFSPDDADQESPTTCSLFEKGQLMGDGNTLMEEFERGFAVSEGEDFVLLREFEAPDRETASLIFQTYMDGWWRIKETERC